MGGCIPCWGFACDTCWRDKPGLTLAQEHAELRRLQRELPKTDDKVNATRHGVSPGPLPPKR
jgi:hypothetical protein